MHFICFKRTTCSFKDHSLKSSYCQPHAFKCTFPRLLGCTPRCARVAPACTSPRLAPGFRRGRHQFHTTLRGEVHLNLYLVNSIALESLFCFFKSLTVDVVLQCANALLMQRHHGWKGGGLCSGVNLHLLVESLPRKDSGFFRNVAGTRLLLHFKKKLK